MYTRILVSLVVAGSFVTPLSIPLMTKPSWAHTQHLDQARFKNGILSHAEEAVHCGGSPRCATAVALQTQRER